MLPIAIEVEQIVRPRPERVIHARLQCGTLTEIDPVPQQMHGQVPADFRRRPLRSIVHNHHLYAFSQQPPYGVAQHRALVETGHHREHANLIPGYGHTFI